MAHNRSMGAPENYVSLDELAVRVPDGALLAIPKEEGGGAMAATRALIRRRVKNLHLICVPVGGMQADLLIGAGAVGTIECSGVSLGEFGAAPRFTHAVRSGTVKIRDATCQAIYSAVQAAEKGAPFIAIRGLLGSDVLKHRADWKVIENPFESGDPVVVVPAIRPDIALAHVRLGDRHGNVWVGERREITILAHAAQETLITVEEIHDGNLMEDERLVGNTISSLYVSA